MPHVRANSVDFMLHMLVPCEEMLKDLEHLLSFGVRVRQ
jgi:hypothetical protein